MAARTTASRFAPPRDYHAGPGDEAQLRVELSKLTDSVESELERLDALKQPTLRRRFIAASGAAALDDLLIIDTSAAAVTVTLPRIAADSGSRVVAYLRRDTANALTFATIDGALINAAAPPFTAASATGRQPDIFCDGSAWWA